MVERGHVNLIKEPPCEVPEELRPWCLFLESMGHVVLANLEDPVVAASPEPIGLLPLPLRSVLSSEWRIQGGFPLVKSSERLGFHTQHGLLYDPAECEFESDTTGVKNLVAMHEAILEDINEIRVLNRWGWSTKYAVRCSRKTAERAWGKSFVAVPADATFRVLWSTRIDIEADVTTGMSLEVQCGKESWRPLPEVERTSFSAEVLADRLGSYLDTEVPEHLFLAAIDSVLLRLQLDPIKPRP